MLAVVKLTDRRNVPLSGGNGVEQANEPAVETGEGRQPGLQILSLGFLSGLWDGEIRAGVPLLPAADRAPSLCRSCVHGPQHTPECDPVQWRRQTFDSAVHG
jgi:hypothetical protein